MLINYFDTMLASYSSLAEIKHEEINQADWVQIEGFCPVGIYHSLKKRWKGTLPLSSDPTVLIRSTKEKKAVLDNRQLFENEGYRFETVPVTEQLFHEFVDLYAETTQQKERYSEVNLKEQILAKVLVGVPAYITGMFKGTTLESGLAFSIKGKEMMVSVGAKKKFPHLRGGVGGVLEVELIKFCQANNIATISHGLEENPSGITSKAGIFEFKARYGFTAYPEGSWVTTFILNSNSFVSDFIFATIHDNQLCYKVLSDFPENLQKKYQTHLVPLVIQESLSESINRHRQFLLSQGHL